MASGIYRIDLGNENFYIGSAVNLAKREGEHRTGLKRQVHDNSRVQHCWNKYQIFKFAVLEECTKDNLIVREQFYLDQHYKDPKMTNISPTAGSTIGYVHSAETRAKLSAANKGRKYSAETRAKMSGRVLSAETRAKLSAANKGKILSAEHRAKISAAAKLRPPVSAETRKKISVAAKRRKHLTETRTKMSKAAKAYYARKREAA